MDFFSCRLQSTVNALGTGRDDLHEYFYNVVQFTLAVTTSHTDSQHQDWTQKRSKEASHVEHLKPSMKADAVESMQHEWKVL